MNINYFIYIINLINIAYKHKKMFIKIYKKSYSRFWINYLLKYNYIKNTKFIDTHNKIVLFLNYYKHNYINYKILFLCKKQKFCINKVYIPKLNYNYLISISSKKKLYVIDKNLSLKLKNNGKIIAILY